MFVVQLDVTVVNVALPSIGADFRSGTSALQWVVSGYSVAFAALLLAAGSAGDIYGHRRVVLTGFAVFGLASVGCALAPGLAFLVAARIAQGVGAAILLPGTIALITKAYPGSAEQSRALGIWAGTAALALPSGPVLGGALVDAFGWRSVFWINVPILVCAASATVVVAPESVREVDRRMDIAGSICAAVFLGGVVFFAIEAGATGSTMVLIAVGVLAVAALVAFVVVERGSAAPMLPLELIRSRAFVGANAVSLLMNFVGIGMIFVVGLYLQQVRELSPLRAGVALLPLFVPLAVLAPIAGKVTARMGSRPPAVVGLLTGVLGCLLLTRVGTGWSLLAVGTLLLGIGMGLLTAPIVAAAMRSAPPQYAGVASGVNNTARQAGGAFGVACLGLAGVSAAAAVCAALWLSAAVVVLLCVDR
ncbi:MFS transporter [Antrihabitans cavernicola]|uniref:MFS transporter n=2 Tax=Antrihabitans cavernicola TaxID=2495913 RepID=A0A5A7SCP6_9NOCA|nr:MFS transporter [Spelaeibacter cavernicola]